MENMTFQVRPKSKVQKRDERFNDRTMKKREYKVLYRLYRGDCWDHMNVPTSMQNHLREQRDTYFQHISPDLPEQFKYKPVSDAYWSYLMESWGDWGADRQLARIEKATSWYFNGGSVADATRIMRGQI